VETNTKETRTLGLINRILEIIADQNSPEIKTLVTHRFPDDDGWFCLWLIKKFVPKTANAELVFVNAGEILPGSEDDPSVLHFDTGGGENDQHGKGLHYVSSAMLLTDRLELSEDPGLKPLLELTKMVDNIEPLPPTSIHFAIEGYPRHPDFKRPDETIDWKLVQREVFRLFDIVYAQETKRSESRKNLEKFAEWTTLPNGLRVASLLWHPECREAAFEEGATVVIWTVPRGKNHFYTGIQTHRQYPLYLDNVVASLRGQEAKVRQTSLPENPKQIGRQGPWYLHDSKRLILNGSRSWKPTEEEYTKLAPRQIVGLVLRTLSTIPREIVSRWNEK